MFAQVARFELSQQLRGPVFWIVFTISALMVLGSIGFEQIEVGPLRAGGAAAPLAVAQIHLIWSLFYLFTAAAFVADTALRDELSGLAPVIRTTPASRRALLLGRFVGAFAATALCFLSVPLAVALAALSPWLDDNALLPEALAFALVGLGLPNLFLACATFFALATLTRSLMAAYLGAVALLVAYGLGSRAIVGGIASTAALLEPFGLAALAHATEGWTAAERMIRVPGLTDLLLANRALALGTGAALLLAALTIPARSARRPRRIRHDHTAPRPRAAPLPQPRFGPAAAAAQLSARTRLEVGQVFGSPAFAVLVLLGLASAAAALWSASSPGSAPTPALVAALAESFRLVPITVALFYAGELMWNEREHRMHEIVGAAPLPDWAFLVPKLLALVVALAALIAATALAAIAVQLARGEPSLAPGAYVPLYILPKSFDFALVAALALFFQAIAPNKLAGWGLMVLYLIGSLALESLGLTDPLYRFGRYPGWPVPGAGADAYRLYWGALALALLLLAFALVGRGVDRPFAARLRALPFRLRGALGFALAAALATFAITGVMLARV